MSYPNCKNCMHSHSLRCVDCNWGDKFEDRLSARERMAQLKLDAARTSFSDKKLVGSIMDGYSYVDTDVANTYQMAANEIIKQTLNNIYGKKEEKNMNSVIYDLAKTNGLGTLKSGDVEIPVRIKEINHAGGLYRSTTEIVCERVSVWDDGTSTFKKHPKKRSDLIKNVYFNNPVTVVIWTDGSKTIVKANGNEPYDPEKGLAMAIAKKFMGDNDTKSNYYEVFKKWLPKPKKDSFNPASRLGPVDEDRWHIWVTHLDTKTGEVIGNAVYPHDYASKAGAKRAAIRMYGPDPRFTKWIVSQTNPWTEEEK